MARHPVEFTDTEPQAMKVWLDLIRSKTPGEHIAIAFQLSGFAFRMAESGVHARYPDAATRSLPCDLMLRAYGWDPQQP
jgi:hypothetical protein